MKNFLNIFMVVVLSLYFCVSCVSNSENIKEDKDKIKIGVTSVPHGKILENLKNTFKMDFEIVNYVDYEALNRDLVLNKIQANFFQTREYLDNFNRENNQNLVELAGVHLEPLIIYSSKYKSIDNVGGGSIVYIPNDKVNRNRALKLLENASLITLVEDFNNGHSVMENPKNLIINEIPVNSIPAYYSESDLVVLNTNVALENSIFPHKDGIFYEKSFSDESKVNVFVTREDLKTSVELKDIARNLNSHDVFKFINSNYKGFVKPVF